MLTPVRKRYFTKIGWLVGCFGLNGPLRQYFSLYRAVSKRGRKNREMIDERKNVQITPTRTYCKHSKPLPYSIQISRTPRQWKITQHHRTTRPPQLHQDKIHLVVVFPIWAVPCPSSGWFVRAKGVCC